ncbi:MAG: PAS domain S-box protein, partial [Candidatus Hydrogenedentes bacterium]|nr:PAS domain S-box protein [Candidatus Hydrogenedentota bacterium]
MPRFKRLWRDRPYYLIPIMLGMAGVLFSAQLEDPALQGIVVLLCLAVPLIVGGNLLARVYSDGLQRLLLMAGMLTLTIGAVVTVSGLSESLVSAEYVSEEVGELSSFLGMGSLLLGLLVVLYSMVRSQALIDELSDRFRHVADHMGEGFLLFDAEGTVLIINDPLTKMTGIEADAVLGHKVQELAKEYDVDTIFRHTERRDRALASEYELDWTRGDESIRLLVHESPLFDRHKRPVGFLLTVHDISVEHRLKKRLEEYTEGLQVLVEDRTEKLRASERRFRELLVNMNEGFLTIDRAFTVRFANERMQKLLRLEADELLGRDVFELVDIDERERLRAALAQVESGLPQRKDQDYTLVRLDRTCVPVKVSIAPIDEATEDGMYLSLVVTDVQELKEMHLELEFRAKELELANQELRETDRAKDLFLSNVSHELRTPLGTIGGYIEMLRGEDLGRIEPPQKAALDVMSHNVERLSSMINEMIESSRMEILGI